MARRVIDPMNAGEEHKLRLTDRTEVVVRPIGPDDAPLLQLDAQRAYLADPADGTVHEIDFADGARVARTIELPVAPVAFAEAGL
jgi:hypothetical protein